MGTVPCPGAVERLVSSAGQAEGMVNAVGPWGEAVVEPFAAKLSAFWPSDPLAKVNGASPCRFGVSGKAIGLEGRKGLCGGLLQPWAPSPGRVRGGG